MPKFENRFVHFTWDDSLEGKKGFFADNIDDLRNSVIGNGYKNTVSESDHKCKPFYEGGSYWRFFYHDPNYEPKLAYEKGKKIQFKCFGDWTDIDTPAWSDDTKYRIKPENTYCVIAGVSLRLVVIKKSSVKEGAHIFYESDSLEDCVDWINDRRKFEDVMVAYSEGKEVEFLNVGNIWCRALTPEWKIGTKYRIKPKKYRAFKNTDELKKKWEELCPTNIHRPSLCEPLIWVKSKLNDSTGVISRFADTVVGVSYTTLDLKELFETFTFLDGTPCGIEVTE